MRLIDNPLTVVIDKIDLPNPRSQTEMLEFAKKTSLIQIQPFRLQNIMLELSIPAQERFTEWVTIIFWSDEFRSYYSIPFYLPHVPRLQSQDKTRQSIRLLNTGSFGNDILTLVDHISMYRENNSGVSEYSINISTKFTYQIRAGKLFDEFWFPDGQQHHEIGDSFEYKKGIEATVMEINTEHGIAFCSALGFLS